MKFDQFNQLAIGSRVVLLMAMELLMENGREFIQNTEKAKLVSGIKSAAGNLVAADVLVSVVDTAKELARLRTCELLGYVKCSALEFSQSGEQEPETCPVCGSDVEIGDDYSVDGEGFYQWTCPDCGTTGKGGYKKVFTQHYDVTGRDGKPLRPARR